ncbi:alpha/beta hydrolase [Crocosphaera sp.]|uniref:alpha/beta hydrolase n=1 Tax=Crocosphaera sp. TaxID=2729996 RepID=UPI00262DF056|nr:alpha/beta hydrolase [Crocosphaera sp.]MDJ0580954.1 alpha/beta hydrolase [Crocosphaera sp.]
MIIVTNRNLQEQESPDKKFGENFNENGPTELRVAEANKIDGQWQVEIFPDQLSYQGTEMPASEVIFLREQEQMKVKKQNCLFYVHGFNTSFKDALDIGYSLETNYNVKVLLFTWPSNGSESRRILDRTRGILSYKSDKREAAESIGGLDRCFDVLRIYLDKYRDLACNQSFNLACHSMGNYLLEQLVRSDLYSNETIFFDNIGLLAADVNNQGHEEWVDRLAYRKRLYVTINEDDFALAASRAKFGEQQLARLGHWIRNLTAEKPFYIDLTDQVGTSHSYFNDESLQQAPIRKVFDNMFNGLRAERDLVFNSSLGVYQVP